MTPPEIRDLLLDIGEEYDEAHADAQHALAGYQETKATYDAAHDRLLEIVESETTGDGKPKYTNAAQREAEVLRRLDAEQPGLSGALADAGQVKTETSKVAERLEQRLKNYRVVLTYDTAEIEREAARLRASIAATPAAPPALRRIAPAGPTPSVSRSHDSDLPF
jgi:uncharacterized protein involved in exopolysaccharide biosynthesis